MRRGEICWLKSPEAGRRPVCVLTRDLALPVLRNILVASITRTIRNIPTEVRLGPDEGMLAECVVTLDNLQTVPRAMLSEPITTLSGLRMHEVCLALNRAVGC